MIIHAWESPTAPASMRWHAMPFDNGPLHIMFSGPTEEDARQAAQAWYDRRIAKTTRKRKQPREHVEVVEEFEEEGI